MQSLRIPLRESIAAKVVCRMREKLITYFYFVVKIPDKARRGRVGRRQGETKLFSFSPDHQEIRSSAFECIIISTNSPILDRRRKRSPVFVLTTVRSWRVRPST